MDGEGVMGKTRYPSGINYSGQNIVQCVCKHCGLRFASKNKRRKHVCNKLKSRGCYFWFRAATATGPAGTTVSKRGTLPAGDFGITEYTWGYQSLWFVNADKFTGDERQRAWEASGMR